MNDAVLDAEAAILLARLAEVGYRPAYELTPPECRAQYRRSDPKYVGEPLPVAAVEDRLLAGVPVRLYRPTKPAAEPLPILVFFHGGGWVIGDLDTHDGTCRRLCEASGCLVVSVDYRLGPEHRFPAAVDDCWAVTRAVAADGAALGGDPARIAVAGDSAGGNLAAVVSLLARDAGGPRLGFQLLIYPATDMTCAMPSHESFAEGYILTSRSIRWFAGHYLSGPDEERDWRASPLFAASHAGLPPALIVTAGFDPLRDEGLAYARKLNEAGGQADYVCFGGQVHGFIRFQGLMPQAVACLDHCGAAVKAALVGES